MNITMQIRQTLEAALSWIKLVQAGFTHRGVYAQDLEPAVRSFWLYHGIEWNAIALGDLTMMHQICMVPMQNWVSIQNYNSEQPQLFNESVPNDSG
jgi:hypothetical protein